MLCCRSLSLTCLAFILAIGCSDSGGTSGGSSDSGTEGSTGDTTAGPDSNSDATNSSGSSPSGSDSATETGTSDATDATETTATETGTVPEPYCGDGKVDPGEECDDANDVDADACTNMCALAECGDGIVHDGEACDDGNADPADGCTNQCALPECGDGIVHMGEECDAGDGNGPGQACLADCVENVCGDGDVGPGEGCDDGNDVDEDACTNLCKLATCGDGVLHDGETCDDGNMDNTDSCLDTCVDAVCGDGYVQMGVEECDEADANSNAGACTLACPQAACGDGLVYEGQEECDDGDMNGEMQSCLDTCVLNVCGDGFVGPGEECDDGNLEAKDGCSILCGVELLCDGKLYACGNGIDDDMDGKIDLDDPECISPCDDDEGFFKTGIPGDNVDACKQDCFFDGNSGSGDDKCEWNLKCDPENPGGESCPYDPDYMNCPDMQVQMCLDYCQVPNGCDCFGCCTVTVEGMEYNIYIGDEDCQLNNVEMCESCTPNQACLDACVPEDCEICFGQNEDDLPPECDGMPQCDMGVTPCLDSSDCADGEFCQTGCCVPIKPQ